MNKTALIFIAMIITGSASATDRIDPQTFLALATTCVPQAPLQTIRAITRTESDFYPYALSINQPKRVRIHLQRQPLSAAEGIYWTTWLLQRNYTVSIGLMQINSADALQHGYVIAQLFDPCANLQLGWKILTEKYQAPAAKYGPGQHALHEALSLYNSGSPRLGFANGYVDRVIHNATAKPTKGK